MKETVTFLLPVLPLLALLVSLLLGHYPGHRTIVRISERIATRSRRPARSEGSLHRRAPRRAAHGGLLLAHSLSGRAPPA